MGISKPGKDLLLFLDRVYQRYHRAEYLGTDPLVQVRRFDDSADREVAALFAALLAYGAVKQINNSLQKLFSAMDNAPARFIREFDYKDARRRLSGFKHRFADETDILCLCWLLHQAMRDGGLEKGFLQGVRTEDEDLVNAAGAFVDYLLGMEFAPHFDRATMLNRGGFKHLLPRADKGSACKRIHMFLRWMVRPDDGLDLGLWRSLDPAMLLIPVDTHVLRLAQNLGLTARTAASLLAARGITEALRRLDPADPVRFDFSLCRLGILKLCPSRADLEHCLTCELNPACHRRRRMEQAANRRLARAGKSV